MTLRPTQTAQYWSDEFSLSADDFDLLNTLFADSEQPLSARELAIELVQARSKQEEKALQKRLLAGGKVYRPTESYKVGDRLVFSAQEYAPGTVKAVRPGQNPDEGSFTVLSVEFDDGTTNLYACGLAEHALSGATELPLDSDVPILPPEALVDRYANHILPTLEAALLDNGDFVRLAGKWFPFGLLADLHAGHLNLAEALLDMESGGPLTPAEIVKDLDLPANINPSLQIFSLNYALQEDDRFDEVGPAGKVLWYLHRYAPEDVLKTPLWLEFDPAQAANYPPLPEELAALAADLDDEFGHDYDQGDPQTSAVSLLLTYPHVRAGTLPLSPRLAPLFPTAYAAPRIRFEMVDDHTQEKIPAWVVRAGRYVAGLGPWYTKYNVQPGTRLQVHPGSNPGEVRVEIHRQRAKREWVRTADSDGELRLTTNQHAIEVTYEEESIAVINDVARLDALWHAYKRRPFENILRHVFNEQAKLNLQNRVHAKSLYSAVNLVRRATPEMVFGELLRQKQFAHVGDAYWRLELE